MYDMKPLIQRFRDNRRRLGINQTEFARRLGVSLATITRWERANMVYTPDLRQLSLIADMFETTVWELLAPDALDTITPDETTAAEPTTPETEITAPEPPFDDITNPVSNDEEEQHDASTVMTDEIPQQSDIPSPVTDDALAQATDTPTFSTGDETTKETAPIDPSESVNNDEMQEVPSTVTSDELKPESDTPEPVTDDELPQAKTAPETQAAVNPDKITETPTDIRRAPNGSRIDRTSRNRQ